MDGYTDGQRLMALARRPVPVQIHFLALPHSTASTIFDYFVTDRVMAPPEGRHLFSERLLVMPNSYQVNSYRHSYDNEIKHIPNDKKSLRDLRAEFGLPDDDSVFVFCNFNQFRKVTPKVFDVWMSILRQVPNSVLWLLPPHSGFAGVRKRVITNRATFVDVWFTIDLYYTCMYVNE
jgi:protein O-GlcNAc transferase